MSFIWLSVLILEILIYADQVKSIFAHCFVLCIYASNVSALNAQLCLWQDVSASLSRKYPELYKEGIRNTYFNKRVVVTLALFSFYQSLIVYTFVATSSSNSVDSSGKMFGLWDVSTMAFNCIVVTVNLRILLMCDTITKWHHISIGGSILAWLMFILVYSGVYTPKVSLHLFCANHLLN